MRNLSEGMEGPAREAWIDTYCAAHPLDDLSAATRALVTELTGKWLAAHPAHK